MSFDSNSAKKDYGSYSLLVFILMLMSKNLERSLKYLTSGYTEAVADELGHASLCFGGMDINNGPT